MGGRGSCRRTRSLFCSKCYEQNIRGYLLGYDVRIWENVTVIAENGNAFTCKCKNCGHVYTTNSAAARRNWRHREKRI